MAAIASINAGDNNHRLKSEFLEARPDRRISEDRCGLDDRGHERRESGAAEPVSGTARMDEVEAVERMRLVLDAAVHMRAAALQRALDRRRGINDVKLVAVFKNGHVVARHNGDDEKIAPSASSICTAAGMVMATSP